MKTNNTKQSKVQIMAAAVLVVSLTAAAVLGWMAWSELQERRAGADFYKTASEGKEVFRAGESTVPESTATEPSASREKTDTESAVTETAVNSDPVSEDVSGLQTEPSIETVPVISPDEPEVIEPASEAAAEHETVVPETTEETPEESLTEEKLNETVLDETIVLPSENELESQTMSSTFETEAISEESEPPAWDHWCDDGRHLQRGTKVSEFDFTKLQVAYPDCVGWLELPGLYLDMPIVQGMDNSFYLTHLPNRMPNESGSIMMDATCEGDFHSDVTYLHAHCMSNGTMFGNLMRYAHEDFYKENSSFRLYTPDGDYQVAVIGGCTVDGIHFGFPPQFRDEEDQQKFLDMVKGNCPYSTDVDVQWGDRLLVLSTCAYSFDDARFLVVGVLH